MQDTAPNSVQSLEKSFIRHQELSAPVRAAPLERAVVMTLLAPVNYDPESIDKSESGQTSETTKRYRGEQAGESRKDTKVVKVLHAEAARPLRYYGTPTRAHSRYLTETRVGQMVVPRGRFPDRSGWCT